MKKTIIIILALIGILLTGCQIDTQSMVSTSEPDLRIIAIFSTPSEWIVNEKIEYVTFIVRNVGKTRTGWITVCNKATGVEGPYLHNLIEGTVCNGFDLKPGATVEFKHKARNIPLPWWDENNHWVKITGHIDFDDRFKEGNENNNQLTRTFSYAERGLFQPIQGVR